MAISKKAQEAINEALACTAAPAGEVGLGVDIVEVERMRRVLTRTPRFAEKAFSEEERTYCDKRSDPAQHYAARFAAKEAVLKALGTGFSNGIGLRDVEVVRNPKGRPLVSLHGRAAELAQAAGVLEIPLSLSHTQSEAVACAITITSASRDAAARREDPALELTRQFKEVRGMLDEL